jgi:hypothetical protein
VWLNDTVSDDTRPGKDEFCKGRRNRKTYTTFFSRFVPAVVGPELFRQRLQDANGDTSPDTVCTISDEAFALLLVENSYDRWTDIYKQTGGIPKQRRGDRTRQCDSDIAPLYTHGGIKYVLHQTTKKKGWTDQGIERYNELFKMVQADRQRTKFMKRFIKDQKATSNKKKEKTELVAVTAVHLLWDDDAQTPSERTIAKTLSEEDSSQDSDATDTAEIAPVKV